jgi:hypothetical protein
MKKIVQELANLTPGRVWAALRRPAMLPVQINAPGMSALADVVRAVYPNVATAEIDSCRMELLGNHQFFEGLNDRMVARRYRRTECGGWGELIYVLTRFGKPEVIVETGVFDGQSSAIFLQALRDNNSGTLISIDLPATEPIEFATHLMPDTTLPPGCQPGWVIPDYLRDRHQLHLGDSKQLLPQVLAANPKVNFFLHDSLHTLEHQTFEYEAAWPHIVSGGLLLSDDIFWNPAFHRFCKRVGRPYKHHRNLGICQKI